MMINPADCQIAVPTIAAPQYYTAITRGWDGLDRRTRRLGDLDARFRAEILYDICACGYGVLLIVQFLAALVQLELVCCRFFRVSKTVA